MKRYAAKLSPSAGRRKYAAKLLMLTVLVSGLPGCQNSTSRTIEPGSFCAIAKPIPFSPHCQQQARQGIDEHNNIGIQRCGW